MRTVERACAEVQTLVELAAHRGHVSMRERMRVMATNAERLEKLWVTPDEPVPVSFIEKQLRGIAVEAVLLLAFLQRVDA